MSWSRPGWALLFVVALIPIGDALYQNPIHFHQTAQVEEYTMDIPLFWARVANPRSGMLVAFRREWARSGAVNVVDRAAVNPTGGPWTLETAKRQRAFIVAVQQKNAKFSEAKFLDLNAGRFPAMCAESAVNGLKALTCYVVGTRLQFSYLGSARYEPSALKMLESLH